ncbi:MAG: dephospho-CoA kinase [Oscillospiraceae bacterium]|jgi:dephospho-CoA kinase|nr:dephospho-CoA kinase [Oscillospiraceae bacterium]
MPYLIGLTGQTGAGKTLVGGLLARHGCEVIDCDQISREIYLPGSPVLEKIVKRFGNDILRPDGSLDRAALAHKAFATEKDVAALNAITHPAIYQISFGRAQRAMQEGRHAVLDAAALFESNGDLICHFSIAVVAPKEVRLGRILARDDITEQAAKERMAAQKEDSFYTNRADYVIRNYPPFVLEEELQPVFAKLNN